MKRIIFLLFAAVTGIQMQVFSQITLEKTYSGVSAGVAHTETYGDKYYVMDVAGSQCRIYNLDHSLWKTVNLSVPSNYYLYDIQYVTDHLFNSDNSIEMLYVCYNYNSTGQYYTYDTRIATETGSQLLDIPGAGYNWITEAGTAGTKLLTYIYDYSVSPYTISTKVYSLPGSLPAGYSEVQQPAAIMKAWPNPVHGTLTIEFSLPGGITQAGLNIMNSSGQRVRSYTVDGTFNDLLLDTGDLPSGIYFWNLEAPGYKSTTQKIVVSH